MQRSHANTHYAELPASANAFDSLGEIYASLGDTDYAQSLKLNSENTNAGDQIKRLKANK